VTNSRGSLNEGAEVKGIEWEKTESTSKISNLDLMTKRNKESYEETFHKKRTKFKRNSNFGLIRSLSAVL
jgi:hypothetical protein